MPRAFDHRVGRSGDPARERIRLGRRDHLVVLAGDHHGGNAPARKIGRRIRTERHPAERVRHALRRGGPREARGEIEKDVRRRGRQELGKERRGDGVGPLVERGAGLLLAAILRLLGVSAGLRAEECGALEARRKEAMEGEGCVAAHRAAGEGGRFRSQRVEGGRCESRQIVHRAGPACRHALPETGSIEGRAP